MRIWNLITAALVAFVYAGSAAAQLIKPGTTWVNQFESTLTIEAINPDTGALRGSYISRLGQHCVGTKYDTVGWIDSDRVVFSVRWKNASGDCKSITSWAGYIVKGKIVAFWDLLYISSVDGTNFVHRGTDIFEPCVGGKPKGCPQQAAAETPRTTEDVARATAEQQAKAAAEAKRIADEEAARVAADQQTRAAAEAKRRADDEARAAAEKARPGANERRQAELAEAGLRLSGRDRRRVQVALTALGFDTQGVDEQFGARTRQMIAAWQKRSGASDTGFLTGAQYATILRQATPALTRYDAEEKRAEEARREEARRRAQELNDTLGAPPPPQVAAPTALQAVPPDTPASPLPGAPQVAAAAPPAPDAAVGPTQEEYRGSGRVMLYGGGDPKAFAEYTLTLTVANGQVSGTATRYCPACVAEGEVERKSFACAGAAIRGKRGFNLRCDDLFAWGNLDRSASIHHSGSGLDVALTRVR